MTEKNFEAFMYVSTEKILICIFSKTNLKILYKKEYKFTDFNKETDEIMINNFLDENIFKIERELNEFVTDINLIINNNKFLSINI